MQFGYDDLDGYLKTRAATARRWAATPTGSAGGKFTIDGRSTISPSMKTAIPFTAATALPSTQLARGVREDDGEEPSVTLRLESPDGTTVSREI